MGKTPTSTTPAQPVSDTEDVRAALIRQIEDQDAERGRRARGGADTYDEHDVFDKAVAIAAYLALPRGHQDQAERLAELLLQGADHRILDVRGEICPPWCHAEHLRWGPGSDGYDVHASWTLRSGERDRDRGFDGLAFELTAPVRRSSDEQRVIVEVEDDSDRGSHRVACVRPATARSMAAQLLHLADIAEGLK